MRVFKFGGASVKDAKSIKNIVTVLQHTGYKNLVVVVSAMGKTTNSLEKVVTNYFDNLSQVEASVSDVFNYHHSILIDLFSEENHIVYKEINQLFKELRTFLKQNKSRNHAFVYDQVVTFGEFISTTIVNRFLESKNIKNTLLDVRTCIKTDSNFRDAKIDWKQTQKEISTIINKNDLTITQGFLAAETSNNFTTTLGREGSDYTAAIFAYCLNAESVTVWKDVPGVLNADPRHFKNTQLLYNISYREAIELAFYGATVIHPKTLQPLQRKEIPLYVRSFLNPDEVGSCVGKGVMLNPSVSCFILKKNQVLISLSSLDFSFMMEDNIGEVFKLLYKYKMKVALIQNSAIGFSVCVDNKFNKLDALLAKLKERFQVSYFENVTLYTIRHSVPSEIKVLSKGKDVLLKQETQETVQLVIQE